MITLRPANTADLDPLSRLCLRSNAHWGYDAAFMAQARDELTVRASDLATDEIVVALAAGDIVGMAQVATGSTIAHLERLYIAPSHIGLGIGRVLFDWARETARRHAAEQMVVVADPNAAAFYRKMGCTDAGHAPSGSIPGRVLPRLICPIRAAP
ncbi:MAG: GNAT family N-acetyltransferase [Pseudomonadota bacterium]